MNKRNYGSDGENVAKRFLFDRGMDIVETNYRTKAGEIDIIFKDGEYLVFAEIKARSSINYGYPGEAVNYRKKLRYRNAARIYLYLNHLPETTYVRFDVLSILNENIEWIKNAF